MSTPLWPVPIPDWFWQWAQWRLGRGDYKGRARNPKARPKDAPARIPWWAWARLAVMVGNPVPPKPKPPPTPPVDPALAKARAMLAEARRFDGPYLYAAEHDGSFADDDVHDPFDCSSSISFWLHTFGLLGSDRAQNSTWFETWGNAGHGRYITLHANSEHVWGEITLPEGWFRFDTSPHGDGGRGPRVRTGPRPDNHFVTRHPAGL